MTGLLQPQRRLCNRTGIWSRVTNSRRAAGPTYRRYRWAIAVLLVLQPTAAQQTANASTTVYRMRPSEQRRPSRFTELQRRRVNEFQSRPEGSLFASDALYLVNGDCGNCTGQGGANLSTGTYFEAPTPPGEERFRGPNFRLIRQIHPPR